MKIVFFESDFTIVVALLPCLCMVFIETNSFNDTLDIP